MPRLRAFRLHPPGHSHAHEQQDQQQSQRKIQPPPKGEFYHREITKKYYASTRLDLSKKRSFAIRDDNAGALDSTGA
jgi:hypothetical protein